MDDTFAGWQTFVIIERHSQKGSTAVCPWIPVIFDSNGAIVYSNGVWYVGSGFAAPYTTYALFIAAQPAIVAYVIDQARGEVRYYDGTQAGDETVFWPGEKRAIGKMKKFDDDFTRSIMKPPELGGAFPTDLKAQQHEISFNFDKLYIPKRKLVTPAIAQPHDEQFGFAGMGLFEQTQDEMFAKKSYRFEWHLVIVYMLDASSQGTFHGKCLVYPCSKFDSIKTSTDPADLVVASITGHAMSKLAFPWDQDLIEDNII